MITDSFDAKSDAIINAKPVENRVKCDVCIATFSAQIEQFAVKKFNAQKVAEYKCVTGIFPVYLFEYNGKKIAIYQTLLGAPASVGALEDVTKFIDVKKFVVFGSAGTLDRETCYGKVMVPTHAYRDEGTSYHYAKAEDYIVIKNSNVVESFMQKYKIPYVSGRCWTTDAFYRETKNNFLKRKNEGCIAVDMECSAMQAVADFRDLDLYYFLLSGDLLDAPEWDDRKLHSANHDYENFYIALKLADEISN